MKKVVLFFSFILIFVSSSVMLSTVSLAAPVKQNYVVTKETYKNNGGYNSTTNYIYNSSGYLTKVVDKTNNINSTTSYMYDSKGNVTKHLLGSFATSYTYDSKGNVTKKSSKYETTSYSYNSNGDLSKSVGKMPWGTYTITYTRDSKGKVTKKVSVSKYSDGHTYTEIEKFAYDSKGNLLKESDGSSTTTYTYNSNNKVTKEVYVFKHPDGSSSIYTTTYSYDSKGRLTKWLYNFKTDGEKYTESRTYTYNAKGKLTKEVYVGHDPDGVPYKEIITYTYGSNGKLAKKVWTYDYSSSNSKYRSGSKTTTYTYDNKGNVIKIGTTRKYADGITDTETQTYSYTKAKLAVYEDNDGLFTKYTYKNSFTYTGKPITPVIIIEQETNGGTRILARGVDYKLTYSNNTKVGTGKITVHFDDGTKKTFSFKITSNKVTGLKKTSATATSIKLSWNKYPGAKYYKVERSTDGKKWTVVSAATTANKITVSKLKAGTKYQFRVTALNSSKKKIGKTSAVLKTQTLHYSPTVTLKSAKVNSLTLTWTKVPGAKYYKVERSTDGKKWTVVSSATTANKITVSKLKSGTKYQFRVTALNKSKKKIGKTSAVLKTQTLYFTPSITLKSVKVNALDLSWTKSGEAKYYKVEQSTDGKKWAAVNSATTANKITVSKLKSGTKYQFKVTALNKSKKKIGKTSAVLKTQTLCSAPSITVASTKSKTVTVSWKKVAGASKYIVYKSTDNKNWSKITTTATSCNITNLTGGKKFYVKVQAVNAYNKNSAFSAVKSVTVKNGTTYTLTFNANGGSVSEKTRKIIGNKAIGSLPTPTYNYHVFSGWYTAASGGTKVTAATAFNKNTTLYAHWTDKTYTLQFNANGGRVSVSSRTLVCNKAIGSLPTPTRTNYNFTGWYTSANGGSAVTSSSVFTKNTVIYAHWSIKTVVVPNVHAQNYSSAKSRLEFMGLRVNLAYAENRAYAPNLVYSQSISAGSIVNVGSTITLYYSLGALSFYPGEYVEWDGGYIYAGLGTGNHPWKAPCGMYVSDVRADNWIGLRYLQNGKRYGWVDVSTVHHVYTYR